MEKKGVVTSSLVWWIIAIAFLVIIIVFAVILKDKLWNIGSYIKGLFSGR